MKYKVLWVGASNRPDLIDAGFSKYNVFEEKLVFLMPDRNCREDILRRMFLKSEIDFDKRLNFANIADDKYTQGYAAQELDDLINRSYRLARLKGCDFVSEEDMIEAAEVFIPKYNPRMDEFLSFLAIREVNSKNMLPKALPTNLHKIVYGNGKINKDEINRRIQQLASELKIPL